MAAKEAQITIRAVDKVTETVRRVNEAMDRVVAPVRRARREIDRLNEAVRDNAMVKGMDRMGQAAQRGAFSCRACPVAAVGVVAPHGCEFRRCHEQGRGAGPGSG